MNAAFWPSVRLDLVVDSPSLEFASGSQRMSVSVPKLDVVLGRSSVLKPDRLADHEGHGFGLGLADLLGGQGAALSPVQHLVANLVR